MKRQQKYKIALASAIIALTSSMHYEVFLNAPKSETVVVASGVVQEKNRESYACGKYDRYTCTDYSLVIGDKNVIVQEQTFNNAAIGYDMTLTKTITEKQSIWGAVSILGVGATWLVLASLLITIIWLMISWAINHSDTMSFNQYLNRK